MKLVEHAKRELALIGGEGCEIQQAMNAHILKMVEEFAKEGHSGFSANYAINILEKLLRFEPITPLTGNDDEWTTNMGTDCGTKQNIRCSRVFKDKGGKAYDIYGKVFTDKDGVSYTNSESSTPVTFPYTPTTEYINRAHEAITDREG